MPKYPAVSGQHMKNTFTKMITALCVNFMVREKKKKAVTSLWTAFHGTAKLRN